jgi:hypothetical protein
MKWNKKGLICSHETLDLDWYKKNTMVPLPYLRDEKTLRIYLTMCDEENIGRICYVDVDPDNPGHILDYSRKPVLDIGEDGTFDDSGVLPSSLLAEDGKLYMFYSAYQKGAKVPYYILSGLAASEDNGQSFARVFKVPVLERTDDELFLRSAVCVIKENGKYKIWYSSGTNWTRNNIKNVPVYDLKYLESDTLVEWKCTPRLSIGLRDDEHGLTIPSVWKENNKYKMIYSVRTVSKGYRLGYAESDNGIEFVRRDNEIGIDVSEAGWDSEMICFGNRLEYNDKVYLFYCGNHYGIGGFGYAELEKA